MQFAIGRIKYFPHGLSRSSSGTLPDQKFTGQRLDLSTELYYYGARYYDPEIGRFISADTIVPDFTNPQSLNRYTYVLNNPLKYIDPSGHFMGDIYDPGFYTEVGLFAPEPGVDYQSSPELPEVSIPREFLVFYTNDYSRVYVQFGHTILDFAGMLPVIGEPADGLNAIVYALRGIGETPGYLLQQ